MHDIKQRTRSLSGYALHHLRVGIQRHDSLLRRMMTFDPSAGSSKRPMTPSTTWEKELDSIAETWKDWTISKDGIKNWITTLIASRERAATERAIAVAEGMKNSHLSDTEYPHSDCLIVEHENAVLDRFITALHKSL